MDGDAKRQRVAGEIEREARELCDRLGVPKQPQVRVAVELRARVALLLVLEAWAAAVSARG